MVVSETNIISIMEWMFVSLATICHISPLCHSFIATLQLGLLDCHNSTRKCWNKLVLRYLL